MWRKVIRAELSKLKIQEKQDEISNSINVSEWLNNKLKVDNHFLLDEIEKKEELNKVISKEVKDVASKKKIAEDNYKKTKVKSDELNISIRNLEKTKELLEIDAKEAEQHFNNKLDKLIQDSNKEEKKIFDKIDKFSTTKDELNSSNKSLKEENKSLSKDIKTQLDSVLWYSSKITEQEDILVKLEHELKETGTELEYEILRKDIVVKEVKDLNKNKSKELEELKTIEDKLKKANKDLELANKILEKTKETNLTLIKREERLLDREVYIKKYYEKAWLPLKL